jgi:hypothetical protein
VRTTAHFLWCHNPLSCAYVEQKNANSKSVDSVLFATARQKETIVPVSFSTTHLPPIPHRRFTYPVPIGQARAAQAMMDSKKTARP